jgi:hypothetical protein
MGRLVIRALVPLALLAWAAVPAHAGSEERKGTAGAYELQLPVGARGSALGGAVTGDASGVEAIFWNPAGLATLARPEVMFSNTRYFADQKLNYAAFGANLGSAGVIGINVKSLNVGDINVTTEAAPDGTGEVVSPTFTVLGVTYAKELTDRVLFGTTVNYVNERIIDMTAGGVAFDFGIQYITGFRGLRMGVVMKNFGPSMSFSGPGGELNVADPNADQSSANRTFRPTSAAFEMPSFFTFSASYNLMSSSDMSLKALGSFQNNNFEGDDFRSGLEWSYKNLLALRGSYWGSLSSSIAGPGQDETTTLHSGDDLYSGYALGGGVQIRTGDTGKLGVDFSWRPVREGLFDDTLEIGAKFAF